MSTRGRTLLFLAVALEQLSAALGAPEDVEH